MKIITALLLCCATALGDEALTREERVVALTILGEARGEGKVGMFAVGCVIQRRNWEKKMTSAQVCLEERQFSPWDGVDRQGNYRLKKESELYHLWDSKHMMYARHLAKCLCDNDIALADITNGANHFHSSRLKPNWAKGRTPTKVIGRHFFYKLPQKKTKINKKRQRTKK